MPKPPKRMKVIGPNSPKRIWIVDDDESIRKMITIALKEKNEDLDIKTFSSVDMAKEALRKEPPPNVLLTDHLMPGESGIKLAIYFRNKFSRTTVVLMSGIMELIEETIIKNAGIKKILKKPFQLSELHEAIFYN